ncbi:MAG: hypothetical protein Q9205_003724 [Flavoplaca limonia]
MHQSITVVGYCAVALEWCDLVWPWLCSFTGPFLGLLAWLSFFSIDEDSSPETELKNSLIDQQSTSHSQTSPSLHNRLSPCHKPGSESTANKRNDCPRNDPNIWSHIDSETDDLPRGEDVIPTTTPLPPADPPQLLSLPQSPDSNALVTTIDLPPLRCPPTHPDPLRDPITLRTRTVPNSPSILDNIHQIQQIIAQRNIQAQLDSAPSSPTQHTPPGRSSFANYRSALPHRQDASRDSHGGEEDIRTPDLDHEDSCASSSDESELNDWEPLVSTALPRKPVRERWAVVFEDTKGRDEELDRFEAALGRAG